MAERAGIDSSTLKRLEERELIERRQVNVRRRPGAAGVGSAATDAPELTTTQASAVAELVSKLDDPGAGEGILLNGVTGSGKTEVYLAVVEEVLARGRTAIVLVPEIGLTPQAVGRFQARLGDRVAVLHSALTAGQRFDEWQRLKSGDATVCVGPRSAVFAPLGNLGLIVIDEEHDPSYKQEGDPRYDAREVARRAGCALGSQTHGTTINANHAARIQRIVDRYGYEVVEDFIDTCLSVENLIDISAPFRSTPSGSPG